MRMVLVGESADAADDWIAEHISAADVCVTSDIPLAARCLKKGARVVSLLRRLSLVPGVLAAAESQVRTGTHAGGRRIRTRGPPREEKGDGQPLQGSIAVSD